VRIGFVSSLSEEDFRFASQMGVPVLEYHDNGEMAALSSAFSRLKELSNRYHITVDVVGRRGADHISDDPGLARCELAKSEALMRAAADLGASLFVTGAGNGENREHGLNCRRAVDLFGRLVDLGRTLGLRVALDNCPTDNFAASPSSWRQILPEVPGLGLKYSPCHAYADGRDWLSEMRDWGADFNHVQVSGCLNIGGESYDGTLPGLDRFEWGAFFGMLYERGYAGDVTIDANSPVWSGGRRHAGLRYSINYLRQFVI